MNGYRIGGMSYLTDLSEIPDSTYEMLYGTSILILGVLRYAPHPTHLNIDKALRIVERVSPDAAYFTHISHDFDHHRTGSELPRNVFLSHDGLSLELNRTMKVYSGFSSWKLDPQTRTVATLGNFDGVHRGHQAILTKLVEDSRNVNLPNAVMTFDPVPKKVLVPGNCPAINSNTGSTPGSF